jgi:hypothetical protein
VGFRFLIVSSHFTLDSLEPGLQVVREAHRRAMMVATELPYRDGLLRHSQSLGEPSLLHAAGDTPEAEGDRVHFLNPFNLNRQLE